MGVSLDPQNLLDLLDFLGKIQQSQLCLQYKAYLQNAWRRYEALWIPLLRKYAKDKTPFINPPLDVHWMWHVHFHNPYAYHRDLESTGGILDHSYTSGMDNQGRSTWEREYPNEPFHAPSDVEKIKDSVNGFQSSFSLNLLDASKRQQDFFYQVSLPHFRNKKFLANCIQRYEMLLSLKCDYPDQFIVPYYDIDLAWHAHMSRPILYDKETSQMLGGKMLDHDDSVEKESLLDSHRVTSHLWKEKYHSDYMISGASHRGRPPIGRLYPMLPNSDGSFFSGLLREIKVNPFVYFSLPCPTKKSIDAEMTLKVSECHSFGTKILFETRLSSDSPSNASYILLFDMKRQPSIRISAYSSILFEIDVRRKDKSNRISSLFHHPKSLKYIAGFYKKIEMRDFNGIINLKLNSFCKKYYVNIRVASECSSHESASFRVLSILPGTFHDCIIPENIESLWGPIPLQKLRQGQDNLCKAVEHKIVDDTNKLPVMTVHLIHSLAQGMSCVQMFSGGDRVSVAHLLDAKTLSLCHIEAFRRFRNSLWRGMIIKDNYGDWGLIIGHWTGVTKPLIRLGVQQSLPGYFSCTFINLRSREELHFKLPNEYSSVFNGEEFSLHIPNKISVNLKSGEIVYHGGIGSEVIHYTTLIFSISVLYLLVLPTPRDLDALKPSNIPEKYQPLYFRSFSPLFFVYCGIQSIGSMPANSTIFHKSKGFASFPMMSDTSNAYSSSFISTEEVSVDLNALSDAVAAMDTMESNGADFGLSDGFGEGGVMSFFSNDYGGMESLSSALMDAGIDGGGFGGDAGGDGGGGCGGGCGG